MFRHFSAVQERPSDRLRKLIIGRQSGGRTPGRAHTDSGAGPPFSQLYLIPKSSSMPPGLWLAVRMKPPNALKPPSRLRITAETAGVESNPPWPIQILRAAPLLKALVL